MAEWSKMVELVLLGFALVDVALVLIVVVVTVKGGADATLSTPPAWKGRFFNPLSMSLTTCTKPIARRTKSEKSGREERSDELRRCVYNTSTYIIDISLSPLFPSTFFALSSAVGLPWGPPDFFSFLALTCMPTRLSFSLLSRMHWLTLATAASSPTSKKN